MLGRVRTVVIGFLAVVGLTVLVESCSAPKPFFRGQPIPIGPYTIVVSYSEASLSGSTKTLAVHFTCSGVNTREDTGKLFATQGGHFFVVDSEGKRYGALPFTLSYYRSRGRHFPGHPEEGMSPNLGEWVAVSKVPLTAQGFSLLIENPGQRSGQPRAAIVKLDR